MCNKPHPASNDRDCFRWLIGHKVTGVIFDALPINRHDLSAGNRTLILDCGCGITLSSNGSYWLEGKDEIKRAISIVRERLSDAEREIRGVLDAAGALDKAAAHRA
jgi:exosome complex RNA-binding protein Rrp4